LNAPASSLHMTLCHNIGSDTIESRLWDELERQHFGVTTASSHQMVCKADETTPDVPIGAMLVGEALSSHVYVIIVVRWNNQFDEWGEIAARSIERVEESIL